MRLFLLVAAASALDLTPDNWEEKTAGKTVFLKFYAPWCGHCKRMAPAWDKLMEKYADNKDAVVANVDCTAGGKEICEQQGVQGFPTPKWGDVSALEDYQGGRDLDALEKFAEENLKPRCSPAHIELCDEEKKASIEELQKMSSEELDEQIQKKNDEIKAAETLFETELEKLQKRYEEIDQEKKDSIKAVKESGLSMMKSVAALKKKASES